MRIPAGCATVLLAAAASLLLLSVSSARAQSRTVPACQIADPPAGCDRGNMWAVDVTTAVDSGAYVHVPDPGCMGGTDDAVQKMLQGAIAAADPKLALFSGPVSALAARPLNDYLKQQGGDIGRYFSPFAGNGALCVPVSVVVPQGSTVVGYRLYAGEESGDIPRCQPGADCIIGYSKWQAEPQVQKNGNLQTVSGLFMNWSGNLRRRARMVVFYEMPPGQKPITEM